MTAALPAKVDMLTALPTNGESFLLRRAGKNVLVDGGYKKDNIAHVLKLQFQDVQYLDVVVCTHGDGDHIGGLPAGLVVSASCGCQGARSTLSRSSFATQLSSSTS